MEKNKSNIIIISVVAALLVAAGVAYVLRDGAKEKKAIETRTEEALLEEEIDATVENILGNYTIKLKTGDEVKRMAGYIDTDFLGQPVLHVLSEYAPMVFPIEITDDGRVWSGDLGDGIMFSKKSIDKIIIRFEQKGTVCTLTK
ncbi:MAG: hypothetical protein K6F25_01370 [Bacteroidales bacterium]|nr:hypothetical protein [Bacteroidales bacterium]